MSLPTPVSSIVGRFVDRKRGECRRDETTAFARGPLSPLPLSLSFSSQSSPPVFLFADISTIAQCASSALLLPTQSRTRQSLLPLPRFSTRSFSPAASVSITRPSHTHAHTQAEAMSKPTRLTSPNPAPCSFPRRWGRTPTAMWRTAPPLSSSTKTTHSETRCGGCS